MTARGRHFSITPQGGNEESNYWRAHGSMCVYMCTVLGSPQHTEARGACTHVLCLARQQIQVYMHMRSTCAWTCAPCLARPDPPGRTSCSLHTARDSPLDKSLDTAGQGGMLRGELVTMSFRFTETLSMFSNSVLFKYFSGKAEV